MNESLLSEDCSFSVLHDEEVVDSVLMDLDTNATPNTSAMFRRYVCRMYVCVCVW
jgi:hypothetical protein